MMILQLLPEWKNLQILDRTSKKDSVNEYYSYINQRKLSNVFQSHKSILVKVQLIAYDCIYLQVC